MTCEQCVRERERLDINMLALDLRGLSVKKVKSVWMRVKFE